MLLAQIEQGVITNVIEVDPGNIPEWAEGWPELTGEAGIGWTSNGTDFTVPLPAPLSIEDYRTAVQAHVDDMALSHLYDSGVSLASYVSSTNPVWAAEAAAFIAWRDAVWASVYALWAAPPAEGDLSIEALIASLPAIEWPSS